LFTTGAFPFDLQDQRRNASHELMNGLPNRDVLIFTEAAQLPADERAAYLATACGGNAGLRQKVEALLHTHEHVGDFLEASPQKASIEARAVNSAGEKAGDRIGRYKLLQQIGEGGWGVVFMAEQDEPVRRKVALKVVKPGMDTKNVIARFEAERQALALMDHPNIAHVFDAGTTEYGRPYFVMELVRGTKITDYCDQSRLSTADRLELFIQVCNAVQHAHQKGIIHRDIKPSNILVTTSAEGKPLPKVIDFGIAKATTGLRLTDKTLFTAFEMLVGTPAYMSPEQAALSSLDVDTRSDIYSLGVLLYELLTSTTPFDTRELLKAGLDEVRRVIQTEEPVRPSTRLRTMIAASLTSVSQQRQADAPKLIRSLKGDLDWIVMKALEKDRTRRYQTAAGLAEDIQHYAAGETVSARPPSAFYKLQKAIQRNKLLFVGTSIIVILLIAGLCITTWLLARENRARREAEADKKTAQTEAAKSHQVKQFLEEMLQGVNPEVAHGRDTAILREVLDTAVARIDKATNEPGVSAELRSVIGTVYAKTEQYRQAEEIQRKALAFCRENFGPKSPEAATALNDLGVTLIAKGKKLEAEQVNREALEIREHCFGKQNADVATSEDNLAHACNDNRKYIEAEALIREALATRRRLFGEESQEVMDSLRNQVLILGNTGKSAEAEASAREVLVLRRKLLGPQDPSIAGALIDLAWTLGATGKQNESEALEREAFALRRKVLSDNYPDVADSLYRLGDHLREHGDLEDASSVLSTALSVFRNVVGDDHPGTLHTLTALGSVYEAETNWPEAEAAFREALASWRKQAGENDPETLYAMRNLAGAFEGESKWAEAEAMRRVAFDSWRKQSGIEADPTLWECYGLYRDLVSQRKHDEAEHLLSEVLTPTFAKKPACSMILGRHLDLMGREARWDEAAADATTLIGYEPAEYYWTYSCAILLVKIHDQPAYEQLCSRAETTFGGTTNPYVALRIADSFLLTSNSSADPQIVKQLANKAAALAKSDAGDFHVYKALSDYRQGHFTEATEWAEKGMNGSDLFTRAEGAATLAMAQWQLSQKERARYTLNQGNKLVPEILRAHDVDLGDRWINWLTARILLDEARQLISLPAEPK
jgi:serine/threonine protein kinase